MKTVYALAFVLASLFFISCSKRNMATRPAYQFKSDNGSPDYSSLFYWAAHPWKQDPSDSVPTPLRSNYVKDSLADVFFLYPTSYTKFLDENWNADIDNSSINAKTDYTSMLYQASAFAEKTRVFAPRYRQANLKAYFTKDTAAAAKAFEVAYQDVKNAFQYYLEYYNNGRPFIIASHSQGTTHAARLIKELVEGQPLQEKLICAYLIGMPVPVNYFEELKPCKDSTSTSCFVTWRTYKKGFIEPRFVAKEKFKSIVTNPLLWTTSEEYASDTLNKGGVLRDFNKVVKGVVDAQVHGNVLWTSRPEFFGSVFLRMRNYHIADINFFYMNIAENVKTRIRNYMQ